jgi:hypothetical protein
MHSSETQLIPLREQQLFLVLTIMVGVIAGLSAVLFALAIDGIGRLSFGFDPAPLRMFLVPVGVSVATGMQLAWVFPD